MSISNVENPTEINPSKGYLGGIPAEVLNEVPSPLVVERVATREAKQNNDGSRKTGDPVAVKTHAVSPSPHIATADPLASGASQPLSAGVSAADNNKIENTWVALVKEVIRQTSGDPYIKQKKVNLLQAEYLKKRHNIILEPSE